MEYHRILCVWRSQCFDGRADLIVLDFPDAPRPTAPVKITSTGCQTDLMPLKGRIKLLYLGVPVVYQPCRFHICLYIYICILYPYIYISIPAYLGNGFKYCENFRSYLGIWSILTTVFLYILGPCHQKLRGFVARVSPKTSAAMAAAYQAARESLGPVRDSQHGLPGKKWDYNQYTRQARKGFECCSSELPFKHDWETPQRNSCEKLQKVLVSRCQMFVAWW